MDYKTIEAVATAKVVADVGKYTKDGSDLSYAVTVPQFDEYTGEETAVLKTMTAAELDDEIGKAQKILDNLKAMKVILMDKDVPVIADYTPKPVEEPIVEGE
jgi:hypothetical protein